MQKLLILTFLIAAFGYACQQDSKNSAKETPVNTTASPDLMGGHWIAMDFCARANQYGSVLQAMNNSHVPYAFALTFNPALRDSVTCYNGLETWNVPLKYNADTLELVGARQGKSVYLVYHSTGDKNMTMFDGTTGTTYLDNFIKSKAGAADGATAFIVALNNNVFNGVFSSLGKGATDDVQFQVNGIIKGLKDYDKYRLCIAGDCFVAGDAIDVMTLLHHERANSEKFFGYRFSAQNDTLTIYNLLNKNPKEKDAYTVGTPAYKFVRKKAPQ